MNGACIGPYFRVLHTKTCQYDAISVLATFVEVLGTVDYIDDDHQIVFRTCEKERGKNILQIVSVVCCYLTFFSPSLCVNMHVYRTNSIFSEHCFELHGLPNYILSC